MKKTIYKLQDKFFDFVDAENHLYKQMYENYYLKLFFLKF